MNGLSRVRALLALAIFFAFGSALANPTYSGFVQGLFTSPVLIGYYLDLTRQPVFVDNTLTADYSLTGSVLHEGDDGGGTGAPSTISFQGASFSNVAPGQLFELGTLTYFNGTSNLDTGIFGATLLLTALTTSGDAVTPGSTAFRIVPTQNGGGSPAADADFLSFPMPISISFNVYEGAQSTAIVWGRIVGDPQLEITALTLSDQTGGFLVPEPSSLTLLGLALLALGGKRRSKIPA